MLIILQNRSREEYTWFEVCCSYPENTLYADYTKQKASQACSQWRKGVQTGLWLQAVPQLLNKLPPTLKRRILGIASLFLGQEALADGICSYFFCGRNRCDKPNVWKI